MSDAGRGTPPVVSQVFRRRLTRRYAWYGLGTVIFTVGMGLGERAGWPRIWLGSAFLLATVAVYAAIGLMARTTDETEYYVAGRRVPSVYNGMATAADWMSTASFIGTAGVLYLQGFNGLAYIMGWTGGYCLIALLLAPYLRRFGQFTLPDFIGERYGGTAPRLVAVGATMLVSVVYLVVQLYGVGLITAHLTGFSFELGIFVGLGGVLVCSFLGGMRAVTWTQVAQYMILILAYVVPVLWLSVKQVGHPVAAVSMSTQLQRVGERERDLINNPGERSARALYAERSLAAERKLQDVPAAMLADTHALAQEAAQLRANNAPLAQIQRVERRLAQLPRTESDARAAYVEERDNSAQQARPLAGMPPQAVPFPATEDPSAPSPDQSRLNFMALVFCLMLGTAAMPHVLTRYYTTPSVREARRSVVWSLVFISLLYVAAPALAVFVKFEVMQHLVGLPFEELPAWVRRWSRLANGLVGVEDINADGLLQLAELRLGGDVIVLAAPEIAGLPYVVTCLVAAGGLAAALSTADGLLLTIANSVSHDVYFRVINPKASAVRRVMLSKVLVLVVALFAAWLASLHLTNILRFVSVAFSLAAAAFFPALVLGIFWRHANRAGATAGMLAGLGMSLYYMVMNLNWTRDLLGIVRPLSDCRWFGLDPVSAGVFGVPTGIVVIMGVSWLTRRRYPSSAAFIEQVRYPHADERYQDPAHWD